MRPYNLLLLIFLLTYPLVKAFATDQNTDKLIYKGDTLSIFPNPLDQLYGKDAIKPDFFDEKKGCPRTDCRRGYQAEWIVIDNQLYLTGIYSCCYKEDGVKADLSKLFGDKVVNGKVKAAWVTANLVAPRGKSMFYILDYGFIYEKELELQFSSGQLIGSKIYDNSRSRQSVYSQDEEKLRSFIYSNIKWSELPEPGNRVIKVFVHFSANENGVVDSAKVLRGYDEVFDREAVRIVKNIPDWDVFYRLGKLYRRGWTIPIVFSSSNRAAYNH